MIAIENLAAFRRNAELGVFTFTQQLAISTGALVKKQFGSLIVDLTKGQKSFGDLSKKALRSVTDFLLSSLAQQTAAGAASAIKQIAQAKSVAAARAIAAEAGKGLLGIATATIAVAAFSALIAKFAKFQGGGVVPGTGNRDTVPALLTPGEVVLNKTQQAGLFGGRPIVVNIFDPIVDDDERLEELSERVGEAILGRVMLQSQVA